MKHLLCLVLTLDVLLSWSNADVDPVTISRLPAREISEYRSFRDVTILHFNLPDKVQLATWKFNATEHLISSSIVSRCRKRGVSLYLKYGSYPVVNPDHSSFPENYYNVRVPIYNVTFRSDSVEKTVNIVNPMPGDWFAVTFLSYTDPNDDQILQQGISPNCAALLQSSVDVVISSVVVDILPGVAIDQTLTVDINSVANIYRLFVPTSIWFGNVNVSITKCQKNSTDLALELCPPISITTSSHTLYQPNDTNNVLTNVCREFKSSSNCDLYFVPSGNSWTYVNISKYLPGISENEAIEVYFRLTVFLNPDEPQVTQINSNLISLPVTASIEGPNFFNKWLSPIKVPLLRQSFSAFFAFNYLRITPRNDRSASMLNLSVNAVTLLEYAIKPIADIGGTVSLDLALLQSPILSNYTKQSFNVSVIVCITYDVRAIPIFPNLCFNHMNETSHAHILVNTTSEKSRNGVVHVPHPENGIWYVTYRPFCYNSTFDSEGNASFKAVECGDLDEVGVSYGVESYPCGENNCGKFGHCFNYNSGGLIYSSCVCLHGYTGWGCTDDSKVSSLSDLLVAALLLTLSNLLFIPAIIIAIRRKFFTEAFVYACIMFFSTFYHACDAGEDIYSYCIFKLNTLQFCDFYSAILAIWVTLIAMADLNATCKSLAHMAGAVGIALGVEYNRTSLWVFLVPCGVGLIILFQQWVWRCRAKRACYPNKAYYKFFFAPGIVLVIVGLNFYAFLQTRNNYKYVHSAWHAIMAVSIILLLPSRKYILLTNDNSDDSSNSRISLWKRGKNYVSIRWLNRK